MATESRNIQHIIAQRVKWLLWGVVLLIASTSLRADEKTMVFLLSGEHYYYQETAETIITTLAENYPEKGYKTQILRLQSLADKQDVLESTSLLVAIGTKAAEYAALNLNKISSLYVLIPQQAYRDISAQIPEAYRGKMAAIFIDQPPERLVLLARSLPLKIETVSAITSTNNGNKPRQLDSLFKSSGIEFKYAYVSEEQNPIEALKPLFENSDAFIAIPERAVFNRALARWILNLSFREKVPVIGFSSAYTEAGALVSLFSTPQDIGRQTGEILLRWLKQGSLPQCNGCYPKYYTIQSNMAVARSMGIDIKEIDADVIAKRMAEGESADE